MPFLTAYHTDKGIVKNTNQDALLIKTANSSKGKVGLFVVCDGMGGLSHGELASGTVIKGMNQWFDEKLPSIILSDDFSEAYINETLQSLLQQLNEKIMGYGEDNHIRLGTTVTALLMIDDQFYTVQVGDSRLYVIDGELKLLTKDQTLIAKEIERGNITVEQAKNDPRKNVLLQCVGATKGLEVVIDKGQIEKGEMYILCSDGFHHRLSDEELFSELNPEQFTDEEQMKDRALSLVHLVKERQETDNISILLVKT
ncbi:protein serine/threonine phosphatase [Evansella cellulosilytica DSM 2522]|uniref:Protein serine/threonine phosphatase n=2 Tax=Evansella TaxID=2837485 RepID=E6TRI0_EVAC2|nr:protein serine/threonine phosphatase [Evansella cellulosilytica DSM 2522]